MSVAYNGGESMAKCDNKLEIGPECWNSLRTTYKRNVPTHQGLPYSHVSKSLVIQCYNEDEWYRCDVNTVRTPTSGRLNQANACTDCVSGGCGGKQAHSPGGVVSDMPYHFPDCHGGCAVDAGNADGACG